MARTLAGADTLLRPGTDLRVEPLCQPCLSPRRFVTNLPSSSTSPDDVPVHQPSTWQLKRFAHASTFSAAPSTLQQVCPYAEHLRIEVLIRMSGRRSGSLWVLPLAEPPRYAPADAHCVHEHESPCCKKDILPFSNCCVRSCVWRTGSHNLDAIIGRSPCPVNGWPAPFAAPPVVG